MSRDTPHPPHLFTRVKPQPIIAEVPIIADVYTVVVGAAGVRVCLDHEPEALYRGDERSGVVRQTHGAGHRWAVWRTRRTTMADASMR